MRKKQNDLHRSALFQKGQEYADLGKSSVTKALPDFGIGNDGVMFGN